MINFKYNDLDIYDAMSHLFNEDDNEDDISMEEELVRALNEVSEEEIEYIVDIHTKNMKEDESYEFKTWLSNIGVKGVDL